MVLKPKSKAFTLIEIMIGISILAIASGAVFWRLDHLVQRKRFDSNVLRVRNALLLTRRMAVNSYLDYRLVFEKMDQGFSLHVICLEDQDKSFNFPSVKNCEIVFEADKSKGRFVDFFSSGAVGPAGILVLSKEKEKIEIRIPDFFYSQSAGAKKLCHPETALEHL